MQKKSRASYLDAQAQRFAAAARQQERAFARQQKRAEQSLRPPQGRIESFARRQAEATAQAEVAALKPSRHGLAWDLLHDEAEDWLSPPSNVTPADVAQLAHCLRQDPLVE